MFIRIADREIVEHAHFMWDVNWYKKNFAPYFCEKSKNISLNAKHLQKMLKNVKKKDTLTFY